MNICPTHAVGAKSSLAEYVRQFTHKE